MGQKIFSFFGWSYSSKELLACRLVCKSWCTMITNGIKRRNQPRQLTFGFGDTAQLRGFNLAMRGTRNLPLDRFEFTIHFFIRWHTDFFSDFLNISGPFLSSLTLTFGRQYSLDLLSINFHEFSFTSLKTLRFECSEVITMPGDVNSFLQLPHPGEQAKGILNLFRAILKSTMHLSCVELKVPCRYEIGDNSIDPIDGFGQTLCENIPESVVDLRLTCQLNDQHLQMLDSKLKLRTLRLNFYGSQFSADCLKKFLHQQASTLRELKLIDFEDVYSNWNEIFPAQFSKLKVLCVKDAEFYKLHPPNPFIQLEKLALLTAKPVWTTKTFFYQNFIFTTITEIDLRYTVENTKDIESIPYHFPHIRILRIHVMLSSNKCVEKVFEKLKCLKELQLTFTTLATRWIADPFLTGLTEEACQEIGANRLFESHEQFQILSRVPRRPCLENLPGKVSYANSFM